MPPLLAAPWTVEIVDAKVLKGTELQLLSLQSVVGEVFLSYFFAPFWYVVEPPTVPSAYRLAFAVPSCVKFPGVPLLSSPTHAPSWSPSSRRPPRLRNAWKSVRLDGRSIVSIVRHVETSVLP